MSKPVKVLIVEDSEDDATLELHALRRGGFAPASRRVQTASELKAALAEERWDAVLSDFNMPGFTGLEALRIVRAAGLDIPFILVSATIGEDIAVAAMKAGASDYVMKQSLARLAPALERELQEAQTRASHRRYQLDIVKSEQRMRAIIETGPACVKVVSPEGLLLEMNAAGQAMLEAGSLAEVQSRPLLDYIAPEYRAPFAALHKRVMNGERGTLEYEIIGSRGRRRWLETHAAPLHRAQGEAPNLLGITLDITERKRAEQELRENESRFRALTELSSDWYWEQDADFRFTLMSGEVVNKGGFSVSNTLGKTRWELPIELGASEWAAHRARLEAHEPFSDFEYRIVVDDGSTRHFSARGEPIFDDSGTFRGYRGTANDISDRKFAEARVAYLNRVNAMLSAINTLIVRVGNRGELYRNACRIALEAGGFHMALIGLVDPHSRQVRVAAADGLDEKLVAAIENRLYPADGSSGSMIARAIEGKAPVVSNDSLNDTRLVLGAMYAEAGIRSLALFPLVVSGEAVGIFALYASEPEFFHEEELRALKELAGDVAFAIDHIDKQERLDYLAYYDVLTGLANRNLFLDRVAQHVRGAAPTGRQLAVLVIDVERFRNINDSLGRAAGDALLKQLVDWLTRHAGDASQLARLGSDQFALVLPRMALEGDVARLVEKTMGALQGHSFPVEDAMLRIAVKIGVAQFPNDGSDAEALLRSAETALKKSKASGERYLFYAQGTTEAVASMLAMENHLRQALDKGEFVLHYQPKVSFSSGKLTGVEALIRWNDPRTGLVPPGRFIPILEETGLINDVGHWALRQALGDYRRWRAAGLTAVRVAVNVSPLQLRNRGFVAEIEQAIGGAAQAAVGLELEITESLIMADVKHSIATLEAIRALGVTVAIDDFGTGFSSLSYLARLPVDTLKIDRSFVVDMTAGPEGLSLVSTIVNLAHSLKLNVVAEGVETEEQSRLLRLVNCDEMQGFLFSKPVPAGNFEAAFLAPPPAGSAEPSDNPRSARPGARQFPR